MYLADEVNNKNPEWQRMQNRWRFYLESYLGGDDYKQGEYLNRYMLESGDEYQRRLAANALDNHVRNVVHIYNSFLFADPPVRTLGTLENDPSLQYFLEDADLDGRSFTNFMSYANLMSAVFGHVWIFVDRPESVANTRAEELAQGIRPYVSLVTPQYVVDWEYRRNASGMPELVYMKLIDYKSEDETVYRIYTPETVELVSVTEYAAEGRVIESKPNALGKIPAVCLYANRGPIRGIGISDVADIADLQKGIYNLYSEWAQLVELNNHPSLVKTMTTDASAGAGAIITMPEDMDPQLKPYLLQPTSSNIEGIKTIIDSNIESIDRIAHLGGIRGTQTNVQSGIALQVERQLLNSKLTEKSANLELAEEQIWRLWALWQGTVWDGTVEYPRTYNLRDATADLDFYIKSLAAGVDSDTYRKSIQKQIARLAVSDDVIVDIEREIDAVAGTRNTNLMPSNSGFEPHLMINPANGDVRTANTEEQHLNLQAQGYLHTDQLDQG